MRIIAGEFRGRKLLPPIGSATRPITDRAKQSLFDVINPLLEGAIIYDCFAGTGSLGLEALSRGAKACVFFEQDRSASQRLKENIRALAVVDRSTIISGDLFRWFESNKTMPAEAGSADLVFLDPPYRFVRENITELSRLLETMRERMLAKNGIVVFRHDSPDGLVPAGFERYDQRRYGPMTIDLLRLA